MEAKKYTQFGTFTVTILGAVALLIAMALINLVRSSGPGIPILVIILAVLIICLLLFYQITITVDDTKVTFKMGIGIIGKSFRISDITSCTSVRNSFFMGLGIHWIKNGWLYNVSGNKAIELKFRNKKSVVRIGTDRPEEISALIGNLIGERTEHEQNEETEIKTITTRRILILAFALAIGGVIIYNNSENRITLGNNDLAIKGIYGITIPLNSIKEVDTLLVLPPIEMKLSGYTFAGTKIGNFRLTDQSRIKLFVKTGHPPFIRIRTKNGVPVYLNFRNRQKTVDLYRGLLKSLDK